LYLELALWLFCNANIQQCVQPPWAQQRRVQQVWPVGGTDDEQVLPTTLQSTVIRKTSFKQHLGTAMRMGAAAQGPAGLAWPVDSADDKTVLPTTLHMIHDSYKHYKSYNKQRKSEISSLFCKEE
jgi:hypothetical protein